MVTKSKREKKRAAPYVAVSVLSGFLDRIRRISTPPKITSKTEFPYGVHAGKGPQFAAEYAQKDKTVRDYLKSRLPTGVTLLRSHQHYSPDKHDPNRVAMHIHAQKTVEDLDEAKFIAAKLAEVIKPSDINPVINP